MKKILIIGIMALILTGCESYSIGDVYEDAKQANEIIDTKIVRHGCIEVEEYYSGGHFVLEQEAKTCSEGLKELKKLVTSIDKKMKGIKNPELEEKWNEVKKAFASDTPFIEKSLEIFLAWGKYQKCYDVDMITENEILNCLKPMFDLKYSEIDSIFKGWAPLKAEAEKTWHETIKHPYGSDMRKEMAVKLDEARDIKDKYERENNIYDNGDRINLKKIAVKVLDADPNYNNEIRLVYYWNDKIDFNDFYRMVRSACRDEKDPKCMDE